MLTILWLRWCARLVGSRVCRSFAQTILETGISEAVLATTKSKLLWAKVVCPKSAKNCFVVWGKTAPRKSLFSETFAFFDFGKQFWANLQSSFGANYFGPPDAQSSLPKSWKKLLGTLEKLLQICSGGWGKTALDVGANCSGCSEEAALDVWEICPDKRVVANISMNSCCSTPRCSHSTLPKHALTHPSCRQTQCSQGSDISMPGHWGHFLGWLFVRSDVSAGLVSWGFRVRLCTDAAWTKLALQFLLSLRHHWLN